MLFQPFVAVLAAAGIANAYWLMGANNPLTIERLDPVISPGSISAHTHFVVGGSGFRDVTDTNRLRQSTCTSIPIPEDKSNYWVPQLYFQWSNGSVSSVGGGMVIYYLFDANSKVTAFPDNFRMRSGNANLRSYDAGLKAQQAVTFVCLDYDSGSSQFTGLPTIKCRSGIRSQVNFPMCWDGKNTDSPDHISHVAFPSNGADSGTCNDPNYPNTIPRIFMEVYWDTGYWYDRISQAKNPNQPFVFAQGDTTGYGYHGDFMMGWDKGVLERAIAKDGCTCDIYGGMDCCVQKGVFGRHNDHCRITPTFQEQTTGTLPKLPGNNPITGQGAIVVPPPIDTSPARAGQVIEYKGDVPPRRK
jgi:hypothetical protein